MLQWNDQTHRYQATVGTDFVEVEGDTWADTVTELARSYHKEGMEATAARNRAETELLHPQAWMSRPMYDVWINGVPQD